MEDRKSASKTGVTSVDESVGETSNDLLSRIVVRKIDRCILPAMFGLSDDTVFSESYQNR